VDRALERRRFDRLVLVAPPTTLGALRHALGPASLARVTAEVAKDLTHTRLDRVASHLADTMAA